MVSGPVLLKIKEKVGFSYLWGSKKRKKNEKKMKKRDEISQILISRALDRTKKIRKIDADIFAKSGLGKP